MNDLWAVFLRPFVAFVLLLSAALLARSVERFIPEGRVKRVLCRRHSVVPESQTPRNRLIWRCIVGAIVVLLLLKPLGLI